MARCDRLSRVDRSLGDIKATLEYNERPYGERGWCIFEESVRYEVVRWSHTYLMYGVADTPDVLAKVYLADDMQTSKERHVHSRQRGLPVTCR